MLDGHSMHLTIFWACNIVEAYKLQSRMSVALCLRSPGTKDASKTENMCEQKKKLSLTAGDLRSSSAEDNPDVHENCYSFMRDIRGTAAYWQAAKIQLFAMLCPLGPRTFFITFSADDHHWKDLMVVLAKCTGQNLSPVKGHYVFSDSRVQSKRLASHLWKDFFHMIELEDNM